MQKSHINRQPDSSLHTNKTNKTNHTPVSSELMNIQRAIGNRAVGNMLNIQTKMTVGPAGDSYEQEADQMGKQAADHIAASESGEQVSQMYNAQKAENRRRRAANEAIVRIDSTLRRRGVRGRRAADEAIDGIDSTLRRRGIRR